MSAHKFHSDISETVPWQAQYTFPTQSTKVHKQTVKLVPKNGQTFGSNQRLRIEFPADDYMNGLNSFLSFDLNIDDSTSAENFKYCTKFVTDGAVSPDFNIIQGDGKSSTISIADSSVNTQFNYNPQWADWNALLNAQPQALTGYYIRITKGRNAGMVARILDSAKPFSNFVVLTHDRGAEFAIYEGDFIEIIPGHRLPFGGAHNLINRLRILYGSLVIEDLQNYSTMARIILDGGMQEGYAGRQGSLLDGMTAGHKNYSTSNWRSESFIGQGNVDGEVWELEQAISKCHDTKALLNELGSNMHPGVTPTVAPTAATLSGLVTKAVPQNFNLNLFSGFLCVQKLIPLKWMAAQLAFEIEWNPPSRAFLSGDSLDYSITNVNYVTELFQFDSTYDSAFFMGLQSMGVPLKFSSWHYHQFNWTGTNMVAQIQERARSVKSIQAVSRDPKSSFYIDNDRFYHSQGELFQNQTTSNSFANTRCPRLTNPGSAPLEQFQFRVGGRYYPAQPVACSGGAAEAMAELMKVTNYLGDYTRSISIDNYSWSSFYWGGGDKFIAAGCFENTDAFPNTISGLNAEEQSDIQLMLRTEQSSLYTGGQQPEGNKQLSVFVNYDSIVVVRDRNQIDLIL